MTEVGLLDGAAYRIDIPVHWNHSLVVFYHGYALQPISYHIAARLTGQQQPFFERHYAVIQSAFSKTGWALRAGLSGDRRTAALLHQEVWAAERDVRGGRLDGRPAGRGHAGAQSEALPGRARPVRLGGPNVCELRSPLCDARRVRLLLSGGHAAAGACPC